MKEKIVALFEENLILSIFKGWRRKVEKGQRRRRRRNKVTVVVIVFLFWCWVAFRVNEKGSAIVVVKCWVIIGNWVIAIVRGKRIWTLRLHIIIAPNNPTLLIQHSCWRCKVIDIIELLRKRLRTTCNTTSSLHPPPTIEQQHHHHRSISPFSLRFRFCFLSPCKQKTNNT